MTNKTKLIDKCISVLKKNPYIYDSMYNILIYKPYYYEGDSPAYYRSITSILSNPQEYEDYYVIDTNYTENMWTIRTTNGIYNIVDFICKYRYGSIDFIHKNYNFIDIENNVVYKYEEILENTDKFRHTVYLPKIVEDNKHYIQNINFVWDNE